MTSFEFDREAYSRAFGVISLFFVAAFAVFSVVSGRGGLPIFLIAGMLVVVGLAYYLLLVIGRRHGLLAHTIIWLFVSAVYLAMGTVNMHISGIEIFYSLLLGLVTAGIVSLMALMGQKVFK